MMTSIRRTMVQDGISADGMAGARLLGWPVLLVPAALVPMLVGGCVESTIVASNKTLPAEEGLHIAQQVAKEPYRIGSGDDITVRFYFNPQLDEDLRVRPDGSVSLSLIGDMVAAGKSPTELSDDITKAYAEYLTKPKAVVIVRAFATARAFVAGEVKTPGVISLAQGSETVSQAIASTGGVTDNSTLWKVLLVRRVPGHEQPVVLTLDIADAISGKDPRQDLTLLPNDLVYVTKSTAADINVAVRLYILNNFSFGSTGLGISVAP